MVTPSVIVDIIVPAALPCSTEAIDTMSICMVLLLFRHTALLGNVRIETILRIVVLHKGRGMGLRRKVALCHQ